MQQRTLGRQGLTVSALGLGCMGMSDFYGPGDEAESLATLDRAVELGVTLFDTADAYGMGRNEELVGRFIRGRREKLVVASKFGIVRDTETGAMSGICGRPDYVREACERSLKHLGLDTIDLYYQHRIDPQVPVEDTVGEMARLVEEGKVRFLGLSEAAPETIRRAHAVHPISALQSEYSLWTRDPEPEVLPTCRELGIGFVPYSPLGRGFLSGRFASPDELADDDSRRTHPRFTGDNLAANLRLVDTVKALAADKGCTPAQLALAWVLAQGEDVVPIPGTKRVAYLEDNVGALEVTLSEGDLARIDRDIPQGAAAGDRYHRAGMATVGR